ncbi:MAG TPA: hypothetical protein VIJ71_00765 [Mycobacteriales bacterium]
MVTPTAPPVVGRTKQEHRWLLSRAIRPRRHLLLAGAAVAGSYLAVAVVLWWQVWSGHPTSELTCGCGDPALFVWSFGWVAHALAHGHNPFLSAAIFHPDGMNLLANATAPLEGFLLAPVTWVFGPVAAVNVANTLAPAVSAMSTYWAVRHTLRTGRFGALVAGLVVELSPFMVGNASVSHLQVNMLAFVPVIGVCLHELLIRQEGSSWRWGALLAAATTGQFFAGTELLVIVALFAATLVVVWAAHLLVGLLRGSVSAGARARFAVRGLVVGGLGSSALLAGPAWYALAGPRSFAGPPWPGRSTDNILRGTVSVDAAHNLDPLIHLAGYLGPVGAPPNYVAITGLLAALAAVIVLWRRPAVWTLATVAVVAEWLSLGSVWNPLGTSRPWWVPFLPWALGRHLPIVGGVLAQSFVVLTVLAFGALIGLLADRLWHAGHGRVRAAMIGLSLAVSAAVIGPLTTAWALPLTVAPIDIPRWFVHEAPLLPSDAVVLAYPYVGPPGESEAMVWQSVDRMRFALAGGCCLVPGPDGIVDHGQTPGSAELILGSLTSSLVGPRPALTDAGAMDTVRAALKGWGVTTVVVTDAGTARGADPVYATRWFTVLFDRSPAVDDGARVWRLSDAAD